MYHLAKSIWLHATSRPEYSILLLGLDNAGKSTLFNQIKNLYDAPPTTTTDVDGPSGTPSSAAGKTVPTVGQNVAVVSLPRLYLRIWDVGGQHSLRGLWQSYYTSCHAIVFVLDSTDVGDADISKLSQAAPGALGRDNVAAPGPKSPLPPSILNFGDDMQLSRLAECRLVLEDVLASSDADGVPLLVLANKQDREDSVEVVRIKEGFVRRVVEGEKGGSVRDSRVLPCSALNGNGVREAVEWVCSRVEWNRESRPPVMR